MKYRAKLLLAFVALAVTTNGVLLLLSYRQSRQMLRAQMDTTALSIATTTAALVDGDAHQLLRERADEDGAAYKGIEKSLRRARDANRRGDVEVKFLYTMMPDPKSPTNVLFGVDAEEAGADKSHVGDIYKFKGEGALPTRFDTNQVQPVFVEDQWGVWLSANAPIRNAAGRSVAALGVDINAQDVMRQLNRLLMQGLLALAVSAALALGLGLVLSRRMARPLRELREAVIAIGQGKLDTRLDTQTGDEFAEVSVAVNDMTAGLRQRDVFKGTLVRYMSSQVAEKIISSGEVPALNGERKKITVLFADVRGFTTLSESLSPEEVVGILNEYFDKMIDAISQNHGMLNKFMGDGLMAVFGAVQEDSYQEEHAICAALAMRAEMEGLRARFLKERQLDLRIGIGINTGVALVGNIGSRQRMEFTAIGDTVNLAARLEGKTKDLGEDIVVSVYTYVGVRSQFQFKPLGDVQVKGKADAVSVFAVLGAK